MILKILGIIVGLMAIYLMVVVFSPLVKEVKNPIEIPYAKEEAPYCRENIAFNVDGEKIKGWLYLPVDSLKPVPCVLLFQGFCGTKDMLLEKYALRFVEAGFAALTFDYRHFGESEGEPRQLYSIPKQLQDGKAAVEYARSLKEIDADKIFIWGTSSSGNYGILLAAEDPEIAGIIGQSPSFDHQADGNMILKRDGMSWFFKLILHAQRDKGRSRFGLSAHTFPVVGNPGSVAMFIAPGAFEGYQKIASKSKTFENRVCARLLFEPHGPNLLESARNINCPAIFQICENDQIVAPGSYSVIKEVLKDNVTVIKNPIGHFDIYFNKWFDKSIKEQIDFITHLCNTED